MMTRVFVTMMMASAVLAVPMARATPEPAQGPQAAAAATWTVDTSHTQAHFAVRHLMVSTVRGTLGPVAGSVWYDGKSVSSIRADVTIDVAGLNTANEGRDNHLRSADFFDVPTHPTITFKSKRVQSGAGGAFTLVGDLTMRGMTKEVNLDVEAPAAVITMAGRGGAPTYRTGTTATTTVNRFDFGLKWNNRMADSSAVVGADVRITIDLELIRR